MEEASKAGEGAGGSSLFESSGEGLSEDEVGKDEGAQAGRVSTGAGGYMRETGAICQIVVLARKPCIFVRA